MVDRNKVTYPLLDRNLRVVTGRNKDEAASDSNGSGKTALVNGPLWAFTGRSDARAEVHYICANTGCCAVLHIVVIEQQQRYMLSSIPIIQFPGHRRSIRLHAIFRLASSSRHCLENIENFIAYQSCKGELANDLYGQITKENLHQIRIVSKLRLPACNLHIQQFRSCTAHIAPMRALHILTTAKASEVICKFSPSLCYILSDFCVQDGVFSQFIIAYKSEINSGDQ